MASEIEYAPDEWSQIKELPFKVIFAAVVADVRGAVGAAGKESIIGARMLVQAATSTYADNSLVMGVLSAVADDQTEDDDISLRDHLAREAAITEAYARSENVSAIFARHGDGDESIQFRQWIYDSAKAVCNATESGGFLGLGAKRISDDELEFLSKLSFALGLPPDDDL